MTQEKHSQENGLAVASLILGILSVTSFGPFTGIPALITGFMGLKNPVNKGMSIAGIIMGGVSILFTILAVLFFVVLLLTGAFASSVFDEPDYGPSDQPRSSSQQRI